MSQTLLISGVKCDEYGVPLKGGFRDEDQVIYCGRVYLIEKNGFVDKDFPFYIQTEDGKRFFNSEGKNISWDDFPCIRLYKREFSEFDEEMDRLKAKNSTGVYGAWGM